MYVSEIELLLKSKKIKIGDKIRIIKKKEIYEGILMPRIDLGDPSNFVLKLDSGYNIGVKFEKEIQVKLIERGKEIKFKPSSAVQKKETGKPNVSIFGAGGTIASRIEYKTGAVFPAFSPADLITSFPELKNIGNIRGRKLFDLFSEDMTPSHWHIIAKEAADEINKNKASGVVVMHGTDTMAFSAAALSFMMKNLTVPLVLVGAQRSSDRGSSDNEMNLVSATLTACRSNIAEVCLCMHGTVNDDYCLVHQGTKVRKLHTSRRDAFRSVNSVPFAKVFYQDQKIEYLRDDFRTRRDGKVETDTAMNPNVGLIYSYPGIKPEFISSLADHFEGVVIAGTGLGHVPTNPSNDKFAKSLVPSIKGLISSGIPVVIAPHTIFGRLNLNVYSAGRILNEAGVIGNFADWTPECALVKLMWVLGHTKEMKKVREMMMQNIAGEISEQVDARGYI